MTTRVPLLDLTRDEDLLAAIRDAVCRVVDSGQYVLGPEVEALERELADYLGVDTAIGVSSGTDALLLALMALDVGPGDEVLCPTYTFFATAGSIWRLGAKPVFCDSEPGTLTIAPEDAERRVTGRTKAIVPVHLFGQCADVSALERLAERHGLRVVEDACQAIGSITADGRRAGAIGTFGCFSFFPTKNLGGIGDGGLVTASDPDLAQRARALRVHGGHARYYHDEVGGNFRLDAIQAAALRVRLRALDAANDARCAHARRYAAALTQAGVAVPFAEAEPDDPRIRLPAVSHGTHTYHQFVVTVPGAGRRDALRDHLRAAGIASEVYYPVPLHQQRCFASLGHRTGDFPVAEHAAATSLALPIFPTLRADEVDRVAATVAAWAGGRS